VNDCHAPSLWPGGARAPPPLTPRGWRVALPRLYRGQGCARHLSRGQGLRDHRPGACCGAPRRGDEARIAAAAREEEDGASRAHGNYACGNDQAVRFNVATEVTEGPKEGTIWQSTSPAPHTTRSYGSSSGFYYGTVRERQAICYRARTSAAFLSRRSRCGVRWRSHRFESRSRKRQLALPQSKALRAKEQPKSLRAHVNVIRFGKVWQSARGCRNRGSPPIRPLRSCACTRRRKRRASA
jgi:hypothetical protein